MEAMGVSDIRAAAGTVAAFLTEQDIYRRNGPSPQRDVAAVLTQSWWVPQLSANVITVSRGSSSRQFVKLYNGSWKGPTYALSRGWDYSGMHFDVTNAHATCSISTSGSTSIPTTPPSSAGATPASVSIPGTSRKG
jgi:hypothetical protein